MLSLILVLSFTLVLLASVGCTPEKRPNTTQNTQNSPNNIDRDNLPKTSTDTDRNMIPDSNRERSENHKQNRTEAKQLTDSITNKYPEVNSATLLFADRIAYIGIDLKADLPKERAKVMKTQVAKMIKKEKPRIETVYVTEDADTFTRLQVIAKDIENGKPLSGFLEELENTFSRITPSME